MTTTPDTAGAEAVYDFWLGLIPQFFGQFGVSLPAGDKAAAHSAAKSPPSDWFAQWTAAMLPFADGLPKSAGDAATQAAQTMFGTWSTMMAPYAGGAAKTVAGAPATAGATSLLAPWMAVLPFAQAAQGAVGTDATAAAMQPFHTAQQAWLDTVAQMGFASPQSYLTGFERTFGGLFDALGFGPMRKLQTACQDLATASLAQNQARAAYAMVVQGAFTSGLERLMLQLGSMADAGERVESVLTLLKMWAVKTEEAVHEVLQSEQGLVATAALTRAGLSHRRKLQHVAGIVADSLDLSTRREIDDVYRELHELKRELRVLRQPGPSKIASAVAPRRRVAKRKTKS
jgi:Poly(R)-hydroxyalkanoic acid synthase subunit (PHA_synth_III_E)